MAPMLLKAREIYQFGEFRLDPAARTLWRDTATVTLNRRAFDVLLYLVNNAGKLIPREELLKGVWPDAFVDENSLSQSISALRRALDEKPGEHSYIATVPGRGYQFIFPVEIIVPDAGAEVGAEELALNGEQSGALPPTFVGLQTMSERTHTLVEESAVPARRRWLSRRTAVWGIAVLAGIAASVTGWRLMHPASYGHAQAVIADLDNATGDTDFDHSLNRMLRIDLQQSPYFTVVGEGRARGVLKMMRQPVDERITAPLAREICQRLNGQVYITPAIAKVGDQYVLSLEANDCKGGHSLGANHKEAASKGAVLAAFTALTRQVRRDAGESRASLRNFDKPLFNQTTSSLDALKEYSEAIRLVDSGNLAGAIALYRHVVELDPRFAVAYSDMSAMYYNMGDHMHDREAIMKAYELRDTVNERERLDIEYLYHQIVTGDLHAQLDVLCQWSAAYPEDAIPLAALVNLETWTGQYADGAMFADRLMDRQKKYDIHGSINYEVAARAYHHANMPDKLRAVYADAVRSKADNGALHSIMLQFASENGDTAGVEREIAWSRGKPEESHILQYAGLSALAGGQVRRAEELFAKATVAAQRDKLQDSLADLDDYHARMLVDLGLFQEARDLLHHLPPADSTLDKAFAEAEVGNTDAAVAEATRQQAAAPNDVLLNVEYAPSVRAAVALRQGKPAETVALLKDDAPYELRDPTVPYLLGQAYLAAHRAPLAIAEFEKLVDRPWLVEPGSPLTALAQFGVARAYALDGNLVPSRLAYEKFFTLWKDADTDLPVLQKARAEYTRLNNSGN